MIDIKSALYFLDNLWSDEHGAFQEAITIPIWWQLDNYMAWLVMRKHNPEKARIIEQGIISDYISVRWCIFNDDLVNFVQSPDVLPDYMRYADLVALQFFYLDKTKGSLAGYHLGILNRMYGLYHDGFIYDMVTSREGYTAYKLCLFSMCLVKYNLMTLAGQILDWVGQKYQVLEGAELGGIKTEWIPPEWEGQYPTLGRLANTETTALAIMAQDWYDAKKSSNNFMLGAGVGFGAIGAITRARKQK